MERLIRYKDYCGISQDWIDNFKIFLLRANISYHFEDGRECLLRYKGRYWILTDNGGEFNLYFVNIKYHKSIPFIKNKRPVDSEELAFKIIDIIKNDYKNIDHV